MSKSNAWEAALIALLFNNTSAAGIGDAPGIIGSGGGGSLYVGGHTASPGEAGDQTTNELTYTPYARVAVVRTSGGWTCSANTATNVADITFAACTSGTETVTHWSVGTAATGTGILLYSEANSGPWGGAITPGVQPYIAAGSFTVTED